MAVRKQRESENERMENEKWQQNKAENQKLFDVRLKEWQVVDIDSIHPRNDNVLYVIGNGFDLMHGVRSDYYSFRNSLGKNNSLRNELETYLTPEDIWADFENALAHFNVGVMSSKFLIDNWLYTFEAYDEDAGAAEFYMAADAAAAPIQTIARELPRRFRMWVETLTIGTEDRPLRSMFRNGKVLCFNYTEFVEALYGVSERNVCYIHGCRRKKKHHPKDRLILGHMPGASEESFDFDDDLSGVTKNRYKFAMIEAAQGEALRMISENDKELTKNSKDIIAAHKDFFADLNTVENIITIGHSFSRVDWDYYSEIMPILSNACDVRWYFGCHGLRDLNNLGQMLTTLGIKKRNVSVFRTDKVTVTPMKGRPPTYTSKKPEEKTLCVAQSGKWSVQTKERSLFIINLENHENGYEAMFSTYISDAFFVLSERYLFVILRGIDAGVFLFRATDNRWIFVDELESIQNQNVINRRLCHVLLTDQDVLFVYNNRVRKYGLADGKLITNQAIQNARNRMYKGEDVTHLFLKSN